METYVLQFGLDKKSQKYVQVIRNKIRLAGFVDRQRGWLPHITIDKYNDNDLEKLVMIIENIANKHSTFDIELNKLGNFDGETLFIEPQPKDEILRIKAELDNDLNDFRFESRKARQYNPHITLCTNNNLEKCVSIASKNIVPMTAKVEKIWLYTEKNMELIKEWKLK